MAAAIKMVFDSKELQVYLAKVQKRLGNTTPISVFAISVMSRSTISRFRTEGEAPFIWPKLKIGTIKSRQRDKPKTWPGAMLIRFGTLFQSFQQGGQNNISKVAPNFAEYGTKLKKAKFLQKKRPMLYWNAEDQQKVMSFAWAYAFKPGLAGSGSTPSVSSIPTNLFQGF